MDELFSYQVNILSLFCIGLEKKSSIIELTVNEE